MVERGTAKFVDGGAQGPFAIFGGRECRGAELVSVTAEDDDADAAGADVPHGCQDEVSLVQEPAPGVGGVDAPVSGKGYGGNDEFPFHTGRIPMGEEGKEGGELGGPEHGFMRGVCRIGAGGGAIATSVEKEK